jgi:hypothetical protein
LKVKLLLAPAFSCATAAANFQADDEGSIPFTRSNIFRHLRHLTDFILTSRVLLILTNCLLSFAAQTRFHPKRWRFSHWACIVAVPICLGANFRRANFWLKHH